MDKKILFRVVIEVMGKPKEHVESSMKKYLQNLKENKDYRVVSEELAELKKQDDSELWMIFAELELETEKAGNLINFCFDYMPSLIEIIEPKELSLGALEMSHFLNDLQAKLHSVDMIAKQLKIENDMLKHNTGSLLKNYITVLLGPQNLTSEQLSELTGVNKDKLEDYLDNLIDEERIDLKEGIYVLKKKISTENGS